MVRHRGLYDLEASFGWRDGYDRLYTEYLVYDPGSKNMEVLHSVGNDGYSVEAQVWMGEGDYLFFRPFFYEGNDMYEGYQIYRVDVSREVDYVPLVSVADPKEPWDIPDVAPETVILSFNEEGDSKIADILGSKGASFACVPSFYVLSSESFSLSVNSLNSAPPSLALMSGMASVPAFWPRL